MGSAIKRTERGRIVRKNRVWKCYINMRGFMNKTGLYELKRCHELFVVFKFHKEYISTRREPK